MSFDLLVTVVLLTLCLGVVATSTDVLFKNYQVEEKAQINLAQIAADKIIFNCGYDIPDPPDCAGVNAYWIACGAPHNVLPTCTNKQIGRRFVKCGSEVGELKVITCA